MQRITASFFVLALASAPALRDSSANAAAAITFHETIEPLLQRHCQVCHRAGGSAPFSLERYDDAVGWAAQMREMVTTRRMPPWGADPAVGKFANDRSLPQAAIDAITAWIDGGTKEGDPAHAPPPRVWPKEWSLPEPPDLVLTTPTVRVAAEGTLPYQYVRVPVGLTEARWVRAAELRSSNPQVVHHVLGFLEDPGEEGATPRPWRPVFNQLELMQGANPNERPQWTLRFRKLIEHDLRYGEAGGLNGYFVSGLSGGGAVQFAEGEGKFVAPGANLVFQVHHQPNGKEAETSTSLGLWFSKGPLPRSLDTRGVSTVIFAIPPGDPNYEVRAEYRLPAAATLRSLQPHMHRRGKDFRFFARPPKKSDGSGGEEVELLHVPRFDFNWQDEYVLAEPRRLPAGTVLRVVAHFDNSADQRGNPDPKQTVYFGLQTDEEMMIGYFEVVWDPTELDDGG